MRQLVLLLIGTWLEKAEIAIKLKMKKLNKGVATLKDASNKFMDVSGRGEITVEEEHGYPYNI